METDGVTVNLKKIKTKKRQLLKKQNGHLDKVHALMKKHLRRNAKSTSQNDLPEFLYEKLKLPIVKKTKPKEGSKKLPSPSTDKDTLGQLMAIVGDKKNEHYNRQAERCIKDILLGRSYAGGVKSLTNYVGYSLPHNLQGWATIYPSLNQSGTGTTRFSCSNPNGQNVSKISVIEDSKGRTMLDANGEPLEGPRIRDCFAPLPGKIWYAIDYNQLELRVFSFISREESLIQALDEGYDFHGYVATRIFNKPINEISKQERRIAKNVNFAIIFGAGAAKVNATAGIPNAYQMFAGLFPNVASYMKETIQEIRQNGYIWTIDGYRLDIPPDSPYKGVNYKAQGGAGSIVKNAMIAIDEQKMVDWESSRLVLQIHDELIVEFDKESTSHTPKSVYNIMTAMENAGAEYGINTPVSCERISTDWGHGEEVEVTRKAIMPSKKAA